MRKLIVPKANLLNNVLTGAVLSTLTTVSGLANGTEYAAINVDDFSTFTPIASSTPAVERSVSNNCLPQSMDTIGTTTAGNPRLACAIRQRYVVASGAVTKFRFNLPNFALPTAGGADELCGDTLTFSNMYLYNSSSGLTVPMPLVGGLSTVVSSDGSVDTFTDYIQPTSFSFVDFNRDTIYELRFIMRRSKTDTSVTTSKFPNAQTFLGSYTDGSANFQCQYFSDLESTVSNIATGGAVFTSTGTALYNRTTGYRPIMVGFFKSGDPTVVGTIGDSITQGFADTALTNYGAGHLHRALKDASGITNCIAFLGLAKGGSSYSSYNFSGARWINYIKYVNVIWDEMGTNDFGANGTTLPASDVLTASRTLWATIRANAVGLRKIVKGGLKTRVVNTSAANIVGTAHGLTIAQIQALGTCTFNVTINGASLNPTVNCSTVTTYDDLADKINTALGGWPVAYCTYNAVGGYYIISAFTSPGQSNTTISAASDTTGTLAATLKLTTGTAVTVTQGTTGNTKFIDGRDQYPSGLGWLKGGVVDQYRALMQAQVGVAGGIDAYYEYMTYRNQTTKEKWKANGTASAYSGEGLHTTPLLNIDLADELRANMIPTL